MSDRRRRRLDGASTLPYLLALPVLLYIGLLVLYPIAQGVVTSFTRTELLGTAPARWVGLANYRRLVHDPAFWQALRVTLVYTGLVVSATVVTSVATAPT